MDTVLWQGHRSIDRWQQLYPDITDGRWGDVLARLERRDQRREEHLQRVPQLIAKGSAIIGGTLPYVATASAVDLTNLTVTLKGRPGDWVKIDGVFDMQTTAGGAAGVGTLSIGGVERTAQAILKGASGTRATVAQNWEYTFTAEAEVVFKLRGRYAVAGIQFQDHTTMRWEMHR